MRAGGQIDRLGIRARNEAHFAPTYDFALVARHDYRSRFVEVMR